MNFDAYEQVLRRTLLDMIERDSDFYYEKRQVRDRLINRITLKNHKT